MPYGLYLSADGAEAQSLRLDVIANNMANVDTVGFKRELAIIQARYAEGIEDGTAIAGTGEIEDIGGGAMVIETKTDYSPGPLKRTGEKTDVAIQGKEGFFMVQKDEEVLLTRAGNFLLDSAGRLITQQGYEVLDDAGRPITINPRDPNWQIDSAGVVRTAAGAINLGLAQPESFDDLLRVGENLFRPLVEPSQVLPADRHVKSGFLEGSAVRPTLEMTEMIQASRILEANVNMMKAQDEMLNGLVNRVMRL